MPTTPQRDTRLTYDDFVRIPNDGTFPKAAQVSAAEGTGLTTPLLPGFALSVAKLFS